MIILQQINYTSYFMSLFVYNIKFKMTNVQGLQFFYEKMLMWNCCLMASGHQLQLNDIIIFSMASFPSFKAGHPIADLFLCWGVKH